uniref:Uncharacterized protein n=1 Tax=Strongyloides venezuelensis TaxID=75913 RepID=A0A0K0G5Z0_STRVS
MSGAERMGAFNNLFFIVTKSFSNFGVQLNFSFDRLSKNDRSCFFDLEVEKSKVFMILIESADNPFSEIMEPRFAFFSLIKTSFKRTQCSFSVSVAISKSSK